MLGSPRRPRTRSRRPGCGSAASDADEVDNLTGWLTTIVSRVCLDMLRARRARREEYLDGGATEPVIRARRGRSRTGGSAADAVGLALLVVLETLTPAERLAFVLHDMFGVPFDEIAPIVERSPDATRQLASRARRRVRGASPSSADLAEQRRMVDAFLAASREGDFDALVAVLDPDVVFRVDLGPQASRRPPVRGADAVARQVLARGRPLAPLGRPAIVNGAPGVLVVSDGRPLAAVAFTVSNERIVAIDVVADAAKLRSLDG